MTESLQDQIEDVDFEAKLAAGRDGHGAVPDSFWESYSAFANTNGGVVLLGVEAKSSVNSASSQQSARDFQPSVGSFQQKPARSQQCGGDFQQSGGRQTEAGGRGFKSRPLLGRRASPEQVASAIRELCSGQWKTVTESADALGRTPQSVRNHYLPVLVAAKALELRYAERVNDPQQAYRTADSSREEGEQ